MALYYSYLSTVYNSIEKACNDRQAPSSTLNAYQSFTILAGDKFHACIEHDSGVWRSEILSRIKERETRKERKNEDVANGDKDVSSSLNQ